MEGEIITRLLEGLRETAGKLPDRRKAGNGRKYEMADFLMSALAVFYSKASIHAGFLEDDGGEGETEQSQDAVLGSEYPWNRSSEEGAGLENHAEAEGINGTWLSADGCMSKAPLAQEAVGKKMEANGICWWMGWGYPWHW
jgi:hypothetical protein